MDLALLALFASLVTAICQSVTDLGTKAATRTADDRAILAAQWCAGALLLTIACFVLYPGLFSAPRETLAAADEAAILDSPRLVGRAQCRRLCAVHPRFSTVRRFAGGAARAAHAGADARHLADHDRRTGAANGRLRRAVHRAWRRPARRRSGERTPLQLPCLRARQRRADDDRHCRDLERHRQYRQARGQGVDAAHLDRGGDHRHRAFAPCSTGSPDGAPPRTCSRCATQSAQARRWPSATRCRCGR